MAPPNSNECSNKLSTCKAICAELEVPLAEEKTLGPSTVITFLGIELDSVKFEARLPVPKLVKAKSAVNKFLSLKSATKRQLLSLIGYLHHCCKVIAQARPFLRRLIDLFKIWFVPSVLRDRLKMTYNGGITFWKAGMVVVFSLWTNGLFQLILKFHQTLQPQRLCSHFGRFLVCTMLA